MNTETEGKDTFVTLQIFGHSLDFVVDEKTLEKCDNIRKLAKEKLDGIKKGLADSGTEDKVVCDFLKESIGVLLGENALGVIFPDREPLITELTGVLCYLISEAGAALCEGGKNG